MKSKCPDDHIVHWHSQPLVGKVPTGSLLLTGAILFSGSTYTKFATIANLLNLGIFNERTFYRITKKCLFPLVNSFYEDNQKLIAKHKSGPQNVSGDSPSQIL